MNYSIDKKGLMLATILLLFNISYCFADDLIWHEDEKDVIFNMAKEQDKLVLLFVGNHACPLCQLSFEYFNDPSRRLRKIIDDNYITWFVSYYDPVNSTKQNLESVAPYIADYEAHKDAGDRTNFPILAVINPNNPDDFTFYWGVGARTEKELYDFISKSLDIVSNEVIAQDYQVTVSGNVLYIDSQTNNEQIQVFTITGQPIATIRKNDYAIQIDASNFPKGVLIVHSSSGWTKKVIVK